MTATAEAGNALRHQPAQANCPISITEYEALVDIVNALVARQGKALIVFDGMCCAGKTLYAAAFAKRFAAPVIHMDDFYLPHAKRTHERMARPGGHMDIERFAREMIPCLDRREYCAYTRYDCHKNAATSSLFLPGRVNIIEGTYSMHPMLDTLYSVRNAVTVFWSTDERTQRERLLSREGERGIAAYETIWLPRERAYFEAYHIMDKATLRFDNRQPVSC